jgi:hypothetical protein
LLRVTWRSWSDTVSGLLPWVADIRLLVSF